MSTLRTNALEGVDAKNSITIVAGAGNITTTNVQDGLAKAWARSESDATIQDNQSINVSSGTDHGTGDYSYALTSAMSVRGVQTAVTRKNVVNSVACINENRDSASVAAIFVFTASSGSAANSRNQFHLFGELA